MQNIENYVPAANLTNFSVDVICVSLKFFIQYHYKIGNWKIYKGNQFSEHPLFGILFKWRIWNSIKDVPRFNLLSLMTKYIYTQSKCLLFLWYKSQLTSKILPCTHTFLKCPTGSVGHVTVAAQPPSGTNPTRTDWHLYLLHTHTHLHSHTNTYQASINFRLPSG